MPAPGDPRGSGGVRRPVGEHVKSSARRSATGLTVAVAVAAGSVLAALPPSAWAATPGAGGVVAVSGTSGSTVEVTPEGGYVRGMTGSGTQPAWSRSGARMVSISGNSVVTQRYDGTGPHTVHTTAAATGAPTGPTFAFYGSDIVYTAANKLQIASADGTFGPQNLLDADQMSSGNCDTQAAGVGDTVYFTRSSGGCGHNPSVWRYDGDADTVARFAGDGSGAVPSHDGQRIAYTGTDGQAHVVGADGQDARTVTGDTRTYTSLTWAPDDSTLEASATATDGTRADVSIDPAATTPAVTVLPGAYAHLAWQSAAPVYADRVYGNSAAATNIAASRWTWADDGHPANGLVQARSAVLVASGDQVDAALTPALANTKGGPALMTTSTSLDTAVQGELQRILPRGSTVYLVGGTSVLGSAVSTKVTSLGYKTVRLSGSSRYVTSVAVARATAPAPGVVFLATGGDYHSILEAEAAAGSAGTSSSATAVYTDGATMTASVYQYLDSLPPSTVLIPIASAVSALSSAVKAGHLPSWGSEVGYYPVSGSGNTGTSVALARMWWSSPQTATFLDDDNWHDGLDGASAMGPYGPVMWVTPTAADSVDETYLKDQSASVSVALTFSGTSNVSTTALNGLGNALSTAGNWTYVPFLNGVVPPPAPGRTAAAVRPGTTPASAAHPAPTAARTPSARDLGTPAHVTR